MATMPVLRPCIGLDKEDIVVTARKIGTFETSIEPFEDCCTVFTPRHPRTRPDLKKVMEQEAKLPFEELVEEALAGMYRVDVNPDGYVIREPAARAADSQN
jgi:thiamine biosynthesis protein ThiI